MTLAVVFDVAGGTQTQYDGVMTDLESSGHLGPEGLSYHLAAPTDTGWFVIDVWEDEAKLAEFTEVLMPLIAKHGLAAATVRTMPVHRVLTPSRA